MKYFVTFFLLLVNLKANAKEEKKVRETQLGPFGCIEIQFGTTIKQRLSETDISWFEATMAEACDLAKPFSIMNSPVHKEGDSPNGIACCHLTEVGKDRVSRKARALKYQ